MSSPTMLNVAKAAREHRAIPSFDEFVKGRLVVMVNIEGIEEATIDEATIDRVGIVSSLKLVTGELISRTELPPITVWATLLLYPLIGFIAPWGAVRALAWIGAGFSSKSPQ